MREDAGGATYDSFSYFDGYGRPLGKKVEGEDGAWRYLDAVAYSARKSPARRWLPYATASPDYETPDPRRPHETLEYDAPGRLVKSVHPDGSFLSRVYGPLASHRFDENDNAGLGRPTTLSRSALRSLFKSARASACSRQPS